jgi:sporulation protein YlmC with PRC-barrel domain
MNRTNLLLILPIGAALVSGVSAQEAPKVNNVQNFTFVTKTPIDAVNLPPDPNPRVEQQRYCLPRDLALLQVKGVKTSESNAPTKINIDPDLQANCFQVTVEMPPPQSVCATVPRLSGLSIEETKTCQLVPTRVSFAVSYEAQKASQAQKVDRSPAVATNAVDRSPPVVTNDTVTSQPKGERTWRASKLVGLNVYNDRNESIGSINDLITDQKGAIQSVIIGIGGFLGVGEHLVAVSFDKLKFSSEPVIYAGASNAGSRDSPPSNTTGAATTTGAGASPPVRASRWYPDHAVFNSTKDELKAAPEFKYSEQ